MVCTFRMSSLSSSSVSLILRIVKLAFLFAWCCAAAASWSTLRVPWIATLAEVFPHAKYPPVMFASFGGRISVVTVADRNGVEHQLDELNTTDSIGYKTGRTHINSLIHKGWLEWLCKNRPELEGGSLTKRTWSLDAPSRVVAEEVAFCYRKQLRPFR